MEAIWGWVPWIPLRVGDIDIQLNLAEKKAAAQERVLQEEERKSSQKHRQVKALLRRQLKLESAEARASRQQAAERRLGEYRGRDTYLSWFSLWLWPISVKRRRELLHGLSDYDYKRTFRQACRKRYNNTCTWMLERPAFVEWLKTESSSTFWCSGIRKLSTQPA